MCIGDFAVVVFLLLGVFGYVVFCDVASVVVFVDCIALFDLDCCRCVLLLWLLGFYCGWFFGVGDG